MVCVDLRGYGRSGTPVSTDDHSPYSKRAIAKELVALMDHLGFRSFVLIGHDRGGRVAYRMALDHQKNVERLAVFDVIPILEAWTRSDARFAQTYWPWILLSQKQPLPESYLLGALEPVFHNPFGQGSFGPEILAEYVFTYRDPGRVHGICEEYRAAATIDVEHDRADNAASKRIKCPMLHSWAESGPLDRFCVKDGGPLGIWRQCAPDAHGQANGRCRTEVYRRFRCQCGMLPSKTVIHSAKLVSLAGRHRKFGIETGPITVDMARVYARKRETVTDQGHILVNDRPETTSRTWGRWENAQAVHTSRTGVDVNPPISAQINRRA